MLLSMTGFGDVRVSKDDLTVAVEMRSVNNRYLKVSVRCPELYAPFESRIEKLLREKIDRGTINVNLKVQNAQQDSKYSLNPTVLMHYWQQAKAIASELGQPVPAITDFLSLPGALTESMTKEQGDIEENWPLIEQGLNEALKKLCHFRETEGVSMRNEIDARGKFIGEELAKVKLHAPNVVTDYRDKLLDRINQLLSDTKVRVEPNDVVKEVGMFAERCDIHEEITRMECHLQQLSEFLNHRASQGRKLEFLCQEMFREVNTIASKANHIGISHAVVEMKTSIEKIRELVQNIE